MTKRLVRIALAAAFALSGSGLLLWAQLPQAVNTWAPGGAVADARTGAAAVALEDGRTLITGGRLGDGGGAVTSTIVIYDPASNAFTPAGQLIQPRVNHTATLLADGRMLVTGGSYGTMVHGDIELFDPATGWSVSLGSMTQPRTRHAAARLKDGSVLIAGGTSPSGVVLQSVERFDVETGASTLLGTLTTPRTGASATTLIDNRVLIAGGNSGTVDLKSAELYDPLTPAPFTLTGTELSVARSGHTAVLLPYNGSVLIAGGTSNGVAATAADLFLPVEFPDTFTYSVGEFVPAASLAIARARAIGGPGADEGYAFIAGGGSSDSERYRFATVKTDKDDYYPGETVYITGAGWTPGETVRLLLQEWEMEHGDREFLPVADSMGNIATSFVVEPHHLGVRFYLTANDSASRAQVTFTDGPRIGSVTVGSQQASPLLATSGSSTDYSIQVNRPTTGGQANGSIAATLTVADLPSGVSGIFSPSTVQATGANQPAPGILTLSTNGTTAAGTYTFTVTADNGGGDTGTGTGTLVIAAATANTTTVASTVTATYGAASVTLNATVTPASGPAVGAGSVTFTVKDGLSTLGSVTSGTV